MQLPDSAHTARPWRIHAMTPDFRLEDVWRLPITGGPDDFPLVVQMLAGRGAGHSSSPAARLLWAVRWKLGALLRLDAEPTDGDGRVVTLRDRLPDDLRTAARGPEVDGLPFRSLYLLADEWAAEISNRTMHGVLHVGWVPDGDDRFRAQMAVLVKTNGRFGDVYMAAIRPFRHRIVYPAMLRDGEAAWAAR